MDDAGAVVLAVLFAFVVGLLSGVFSYGAATNTQQELAVAAKVGRFVARQDGTGTEFVWGCEAK